MLLIKRKRKPGLNLNPGLALTSVRTTGSRSVLLRRSTWHYWTIGSIKIYCIVNTTEVDWIERIDYEPHDQMFSMWQICCLRNIFKWPEKTASILRCHHWFSHRMMSEERVQKFHTDNVSQPRSANYFGKFALTSENIFSHTLLERPSSEALLRSG